MKTITTPQGKIIVDEIQSGKIGWNWNKLANKLDNLSRDYEIGTFEEMSTNKIIVTINHSISLDVPMVIVEDKVNNLSDEVNNLSAECFNMLRKLNPKGGIREFVRMSVEFGFKAQQKGGYSEADLINYKRFWLAQDIEWFDNTNDGDIYKNKKGKVVTEKEIVTAYIQSLNQETIELEMEFVDDDEDDYVDGGFFGRSIQRIKTTRGSNGQLMAYEKTK